MSMESDADARKRWRLVEQVGQAAGCIAGGAALGLLWVFALSMEARKGFTLARAKRSPTAGAGER